MEIHVVTIDTNFLSAVARRHGPKLFTVDADRPILITVGGLRMHRKVRGIHGRDRCKVASARSKAGLKRFFGVGANALTYEIIAHVELACHELDVEIARVAVVVEGNLLCAAGAAPAETWMGGGFTYGVGAVRVYPDDFDGPIAGFESCERFGGDAEFDFMVCACTG